MFPAPFEYHRATSIDQASQLLRDYGADARVLAGGQSLIPAMRYRLARPGVVVDINALSDLEIVAERDGMLVVGALARDAVLERMPAIRERYPLIADAADVVADPIVRQSGTVVGSLCHNDPAGDWPVVALTMNAEVTVRGAKGNRVVPIDEFLVDTFTTAVADGELALDVRFPQPPPRTTGAYAKLERKVGDFATAAAGVQLTLADDGTIARAGVAIAAAGPTARRVFDAERLLRGARPTRALLREAGALASAVAEPVADNRGGVDYKKAMAAVLVERALLRALERLGEDVR